MKTALLVVVGLLGFALGTLTHRFKTQTIILHPHERELLLIMRTDSLTGHVVWTYAGDEDAITLSQNWIEPNNWMKTITWPTNR